jgi:hypothetical protein
LFLKRALALSRISVLLTLTSPHGYTRIVFRQPTPEFDFAEQTLTNHTQQPLVGRHHPSGAVLTPSSLGADSLPPRYPSAGPPGLAPRGRDTVARVRVAG